MNKIIKCILEENNYQMVNISKNYMFFKSCDEFKHDYILIYDLGMYKNLTQLDNDIDVSESVFEEMKSFGEDVEKNTNAVYLLKTDKSINVSLPIWHRICEIEELVTYMKRNVLIYTEGEFEVVEKLEGNYTQSITSYLKDKEEFKQFVDDKNITYEIFSKIFIKLNCLRYDFVPEEFPDLDNDINIALNKYGKGSSDIRPKIFARWLENVYNQTLEDDEIINKYSRILQKRIGKDSLVNRASEKISKKLNERKTI